MGLMIHECKSDVDVSKSVTKAFWYLTIFINFPFMEDGLPKLSGSQSVPISLPKDFASDLDVDIV